MIKKYFQLIKPGYLFANDLTALAGFLLAAKGHSNLFLLIMTMLGISCGIICANICNNLLDQNIDAKMLRTKNRVLVTGVISQHIAIFLALFFGILAVGILFFFTNVVTLGIGAVGFLFYEVCYAYTKRRTSWSTIIGTVPGACALVAGYTAVTGKIDIAAVILFLILVCWQLPHFYAIAIYRMHEYKNAGIPVLSVVKGIFVTKIHILFFTVVFALSSLALFFNKSVGWMYFFIMVILSLFWICFAIYGFFTKNTDKWAKKIFATSLLINLVFCVLLLTNSFLF